MLIWMGVITVGLSIGITLKIGSIISRQVNETLQTLETVAEGDLSTQLDINSRDEFGLIAKALNTAISASSNTLDTLAVRNRDTKMLLDAVEQGFFTIDENGVISAEKSGAVERTFGPVHEGMTLVEFIAQFDQKAADWIELGIEDVFADIMPVEVTLDQIPKRFEANDKTYSLQYTPVFIDEELSSVAVVISDITALVENEKLESRQREMMAMVQQMAEDRTGFMNFFNESNDIVESLRSDTSENLTLTKRRVHTLKGNTSIYELNRMAKYCHAIEDYIAENDELPEAGAFEAMFEAWDNVCENLKQIVGDRQQGIEIDSEAYEMLLQDIAEGKSHDSLAVRVAAWGLEPTSVRVNCIEQQASGLARRLGKGDVNVVVKSNDLRLDSEHWSDFWSSFIHVVRNAGDHGIEPAEERVEHGKSESGTIEVETLIRNDEFIVRLIDDGRGIDWDKVTEAAYKNGLAAETRADLVDALFADGVSTAERVTDTSGRGVGMAAIKESCEVLGGKITVDSEVRKGTTFTFSFPVESMAPKTVGYLEESKVSSPNRVFESQRKLALV